MFLTRIPSNISSKVLYVGKSTENLKYVSSKNHIELYREKIFDKTSQISNKKLKNYLSYIELAKQFSMNIGATENQKKARIDVLLKIETESKKLSEKIDSFTFENGLNELYSYAAKNFWDKNIHVVSHRIQTQNPWQFLIFTDIRNAKYYMELVFDEYNKFAKKISVSGISSPGDLTTQSIFPGEDYKVLEKGSKYILINYQGNKIKLELNIKPLRKLPLISKIC